MKRKPVAIAVSVAGDNSQFVEYIVVCNDGSVFAYDDDKDTDWREWPAIPGTHRHEDWKNGTAL